MATEEQKKENMLRLSRLTLYGLTTGVWDILGEGALGLGNEIGQKILPVLEKEMGLEIAGETPEDILQELSRILVDEFGFASNIEVSREGDILTAKVANCLHRKLDDELIAAGVEKLFICPILCAAVAAFNRSDLKSTTNVESWPEGKGSILTFELL